MQHAPTLVLDSHGSTGSYAMLSQQQQQRASFSSKRRVRYGSEQDTRAKSKLFSFMKQKQKAQLEKLRASLAKETVASMALPPVNVVSADALSPDIVNGGDSSSTDVDASGAASGKHAREFSRMRKLKEAKQERVKHLPLFKPNSPLLRHFGDQTLGSYEHLPTTAFDGPVIVLHSPQEEAIYAPYLRAQKVSTCVYVCLLEHGSVRLDTHD